MLSPPGPTPLQTALAAKRRDGAAGGAAVATLAFGRGWRVFDVVCTAGPDDRDFEERHEAVSLSLVLEGAFVYRSDLGRAVMTPGSMLLGDARACFQCGHEHGEGDRCLSFQFDRALIERMAGELGKRFRGFSSPRLPLARAPRVDLGLLKGPPEAREEAVFSLAASVLPLALDGDRPDRASAQDERRAADLARHLDTAFREPQTLGDLAQAAGLSRFHLLRVFKRATGATPHQYVLRRRLEWAAQALATDDAPITAVAFESGFEDLSNFNRSFKAAYGLRPGAYRRRAQGRR